MTNTKISTSWHQDSYWYLLLQSSSSSFITLYISVFITSIFSIPLFVTAKKHLFQFALKKCVLKSAIKLFASHWQRLTRMKKPLQNYLIDALYSSNTAKVQHSQKKKLKKNYSRTVCTFFEVKGSAWSKVGWRFHRGLGLIKSSILDYKLENRVKNTIRLHQEHLLSNAA